MAPRNTSQAPNDAGNGGENEELVQIPQAQLQEMMKAVENATKVAAEAQRVAEEATARAAGAQEAFENRVEPEGDKSLRKKNNYEPKFRTVRLRKYPMGGDPEKLGYVVGWTNRGAYQEVDRSGPTPQYVDVIEIVFLDNEMKDGKLQAEKIRLLDLLNKSTQVYCKILSVDKKPDQKPTGEEINVTSWDPQHGLIQTGETVDGYVEFSDTKYTIEVPGRSEPVVIDGKYVN